ncbi:proton-conducting transporter transmembrane domain-containing protein [Prosthecobacter vanneervenii]|uniref:NADH-quinone oxidoreductase subunit M n=1 Tax=Prosthecobacter vanneervenii TaxID=48466 RepID=A0A7W8DJL3_9BACT|nr:proton-conducting transporter membrane subunit [Prosthecobacter vanneervenii]MBB5032268.1 NADH-quinone oxidoreductase subunit M [Prosthecobacter vanneervenii]
MPYLSLPYLTVALALLLGGVLASWKASHPRRVAAVAAALAFIAFLAAACESRAAGQGSLYDPWLPFFQADGLNAVPMAFYAALTLAVMVLAPRRDAAGQAPAGMLLISLSVQTAYAAASWVPMVAGWWLSCLPFALGMFGSQRETRLTIGIRLASCIALTAAVLLLSASSTTGFAKYGTLWSLFFIIAVVCRKGLFPLHAGVVHAFEHGPLLPKALLFNGHLGVVLVARAQLASPPETAHHAFEFLSMAAVATVGIASLRAFAESKPRRLLAFLCISQASFMLAGITSTNIEGVTGALTHWLLVAAASTGLICIVRALEVRVSSTEDPLMHLGLAAKAPRLATFFLICGLALVGLPGTLGYCAEELIFHGMLQSHLSAGIVLLVATVFNAINLLRLYNTLFLGVLPKHVINIPDALPRERWPLTACILFLVLGGLMPRVVIGWRSDAANSIEKALSAAGGSGHH